MRLKAIQPVCYELHTVYIVYIMLNNYFLQCLTRTHIYFYADAVLYTILYTVQVVVGNTQNCMIHECMCRKYRLYYVPILSQSSCKTSRIHI